MPAMQTFNVQLSPATATDRGFTTTLCGPGERRFKIEAATLTEIEAKLRGLVADEFKQSAAVYVAPLKGQRRPRGFDALATRLQFIPV